MEQEYAQELDKISRVSTLLMALLGMLLFFTLIGTALGLKMLFAEDGGSGGFTISTIRLAGSDVAGLDSSQKGLLAASILVVVGLGLAMMYHGLRLLNGFSKHRLFTDGSIRHARRIAWLFTAFTVLDIANMFALPTLLSMDERHLNISLGPLLTLAIMWLFIWMLQVGRALQFDSEMAI